MFDPLKTAISRCLDPLFRKGISRIEKMEWVEAYIEACARATAKSNIEGGWRDAGLSPFKSAESSSQSYINASSINNSAAPIIHVRYCY